MGNCIRKQSTTEWGGEDWGSFGSGDKINTHEINKNNYATDNHLQRQTSGTTDVLSSSDSTLPTAGTDQVKIKISKKQLEQLVKIQGFSVEQVLVHLINVADERFEAHQRPWRPALQSIPE